MTWSFSQITNHRNRWAYSQATIGRGMENCFHVYPSMLGHKEYCSRVHLVYGTDHGPWFIIPWFTCVAVRKCTSQDNILERNSLNYNYYNHILLSWLPCGRGRLLCVSFLPIACLAENSRLHCPYIYQSVVGWPSKVTVGKYFTWAWAWVSNAFEYEFLKAVGYVAVSVWKIATFWIGALNMWVHSIMEWVAAVSVRCETMQRWICP